MHDSLLRQFLRDERASAVSEYALVMCALTLLAAVAFNALGATSTGAMQTDANNLTASGSANYGNGSQ